MPASRKKTPLYRHSETGVRVRLSTVRSICALMNSVDPSEKRTPRSLKLVRVSA